MADGRRALIVWGGWDGHRPEAFARLWQAVLEGEGFSVDVEDTLEPFADRDRMRALSLVVPIWTTGDLTEEQERGLLDVVASGVGIAGFHGGMGDAFREWSNYQFMVGGQFVAHPDNQTEYEVTIVRPDDPIVHGIGDFRVRSEQYYLHVDPSNEVLATTTFETESAPWVNGCVMPVVWKRAYGQGRVFYSSIGHAPEEHVDVPEAREIQRRGMLWAAR